MTKKAVHDIDGAGLDDQHVERVHVMQFSVGNMDETGDGAAQVSSVCNLIAALVERNGAHGNNDRQRSMVVASRA